VLSGFGFWLGFWGGGGGHLEPEKPDPDPCAGVRPQDLDYSRVRPYRQGGRQSGEQHIRSRHLSGNIVKASQYFGHFNLVKSYNQFTFTFGTRHTGTRGSIIFQLEFPFSIGTERDARSESTGWNLLILEPDCKTVNTSHPGRIN
jgi:hypothetical protein